MSDGQHKQYKRKKHISSNLSKQTLEICRKQKVFTKLLTNVFFSQLKGAKKRARFCLRPSTIKLPKTV